MNIFRRIFKMECTLRVNNCVHIYS